jgi:serine/threonine-protein kinase HipA
MPYRPVEVVEVRCWAVRVGAIALDPSSGFYAFEYNPGWLTQGIELAPTTMPITSASHSFQFPSLAPATYHRLPAMVADALPDDFGNALTTAYLASQGVLPGAITPLDRLAYLGNRGMGALEFRPVIGPRTRRSTAIKLSELVVAARSAVRGDIATDKGITAALAQLLAVGTSAGGARAKAVVALNPTTGELRSGQVPADPGFEHWLLKFDGVGPDLHLGASQHFGRIEYAYHRMAIDAGIDMTRCRLLEEGGRAHFMTQRFDRPPGGGKVHAQTLCALAGLDFRLVGAHDYSQLFMTIDTLNCGPDARAEAFRRMVFNVAAANCDDHTKNVSFMLAKGGAWQLAPAYDVTHAHSSTSPWIRQHLMSVNGKASDITFEDVAAVGDRFSVPAASRIIDQVLDAVARWSVFASQAGLGPDDAPEVGRNIAARVSLLRSP